MNVFATRISKEILEEVEKASSIRWASEDLPTEWPCWAPGEFLMVDYCRRSGYTALVHGFPFDIPVLSGPDFVRECSELMPKDV